MVVIVPYLVTTVLLVIAFGLINTLITLMVNCGCDESFTTIFIIYNDQIIIGIY